MPLFIHGTNFCIRYSFTNIRVSIFVGHISRVCCICKNVIDYNLGTVDLGWSEDLKLFMPTVNYLRVTDSDYNGLNRKTKEL